MELHRIFDLLTEARPICRVFTADFQGQDRWCDVSGWDESGPCQAYAVLSDANRRADYDAVCISAALAREAAAWREPEPGAAASPGPEAPRRDRDQRPALEPLRCGRCGVVSAQPRFVRFHRVVGTLNRSHRLVEEGVFCRACADMSQCWRAAPAATT